MLKNNKNYKDDTILARWLAGTINKEDLQSLGERNDFKEMKALVSDIDTLKSSKYDTKKGFSSILERIKQEEHQSAIKTSAKVRFLSFGKIASVAAIALIVAMIYFFSQGETSHFETVIGQQITNALPDNSNIQLNATSVLAYKDTGEKRAVQLNGEAFFDVTKNKKKPFVITTPLGNIKVVGTSFNVFGRDNALIVTCYTGTVEVTAFEGDSKVFILNSGDVYKFRTGQEPISLKQEIKGQPSWANGISQLTNASFQDVVNELQRQYNIEITGNLNHEINDFTTGFPHNNRDAALKIVFNAMNIKYKADGNKIILE